MKQEVQRNLRKTMALLLRLLKHTAKDRKIMARCRSAVIYVAATYGNRTINQQIDTGTLPFQNQRKCSCGQIAKTTWSTRTGNPIAGTRPQPLEFIRYAFGIGKSLSKTRLSLLLSTKTSLPKWLPITRGRKESTWNIQN